MMRQQQEYAGSEVAHPQAAAGSLDKQAVARRAMYSVTLILPLESDQLKFEDNHLVIRKEVLATSVWHAIEKVGIRVKEM